jgi:hypothetical protein
VLAEEPNLQDLQQRLEVVKRQRAASEAARAASAQAANKEKAQPSSNATRPGERGVAIAALSPASAASAAWPKIRAELEARRGRQSFEEAMTTLLDIRERADADTMSRFATLLRALPPNSALAMGSRDGRLAFQTASKRTSPSKAGEDALAPCNQRVAQASCVVVMSNGTFNGSAVEALSRQLGSRDPKDVRAAALRAMQELVARSPEDQRASQAPPSPGADAGAGWPRIREALTARGGGNSLAEGLTTLLDVRDPADVETVGRFDTLMRRLPYSSALVIGPREGLLSFHRVSRRSSRSAASDEALAECRQRLRSGCTLVMSNGTPQPGALEALSRQLGSKDPDQVREAALRILRDAVSKGY